MLGWERQCPLREGERDEPRFVGFSRQRKGFLCQCAPARLGKAFAVIEGGQAQQGVGDGCWIACAAGEGECLRRLSSCLLKRVSGQGQCFFV